MVFSRDSIFNDTKETKDVEKAEDDEDDDNFEDAEEEEEVGNTGAIGKQLMQNGVQNPDENAKDKTASEVTDNA